MSNFSIIVFKEYQRHELEMLKKRKKYASYKQVEEDNTEMDSEIKELMEKENERKEKAREKERLKGDIVSTMDKATDNANDPILNTIKELESKGQNVLSNQEKITLKKLLKQKDKLERDALHARILERDKEKAKKMSKL